MDRQMKDVHRTLDVHPTLESTCEQRSEKETDAAGLELE